MTLLVAAVSLPLASVVGPYVVILVAAIVGSARALSRREATTRAAAAWFFARTTGTAIMLTTGVAEIVVTYVPTLAGLQHWLFAPIALAIGWVGDDWRAALRMWRELRGAKP